MHSKKRFFVVILTIIFCISILSVSTLAKTTQEKAEILNQINMFKGSNGDFKLADKLKRSEAATLIIRFMGQEKHVLDNAALYKQTPFPDVKPTDWFAPYVGYCAVNDIIGGDNSGKFKPEEFISEKAFLKLILCALGYKYDIDFTWNSINNKAYTTGIVTDISYITKTDDNSNFLRGKAVDIFYNALSLTNLNTGKAMFYSLIDNGVITREMAISAGLIVDTLATDIREIKPVDTNKLSIYFNEKIQTVNTSNIVIYESDNTANQLIAQIDSQGEDVVNLITTNQKPGVEYTVMILGVVDEEGNTSGTIKGTFKGYELKAQEIESDFFRIQSIDAINKESIRINFTHPVNLNSELPTCYRIYEDETSFANGKNGELTVKTVSSKENSVILTLNKAKFQEDVIYTLRISGDLTSAYGVKLNDGSYDSMKFTASTEDTEAFDLDDIIPYDSETILVTFNKEINPFLAAQIYNFYITDADDDPIRIEKTIIENVGNKKGKALYIRIEGSFVKNGEYYLTINNLNDSTKQEYISEKTFKFKANYGTSNKMKSDKVVVIDSRTIEVYFTKPLDPAAAIDTENYWINGNKHSYSASPEKIYFDPVSSPSKVKIYLPANKSLEKGKSYTLSIDNNMKDYIGNDIYSNQTESFTGVTKEVTAPKIKKAVAISSDAVKLTFDREIALNVPNILPGNYSLSFMLNGVEYRKVPLSVLYVNATTLVLKFDSLEYDVEYTINYQSIMDYAGTTRNNTGKGIEFMLTEE